MAIVSGSIATAAPTDPFFAALPARDSKRPEGLKFAAGAGTVDETTGAASYNLSIELPDGRGGMKPSLSLGYSSNGAVRGGVAVGWSLDLPMVERDPDYPLEEHYQSSLRGRRDRLVRVSTAPDGSPVHRGEVDDSFTNYSFGGGIDSSSYWTAQSPDGVTREFMLYGEKRWYLSRELDSFGNAVIYNYEYVTTNGATETLPRAIEYTSNATAGLAAHARIDFEYAPLETCGGAPIGAAFDDRFAARRWRGSRRLTGIRISVKEVPGSAWRTARTYALSYDQSELGCGASALRYLTQIDVSAFDARGLESKAAPVQLTYGAKRRVLARTLTIPNAPQERGDMWGPHTGFLDMDSDGRLDFVEVRTEQKCRLAWRQGLGQGRLAAAETVIDLPTAAWMNGVFADPASEGCRLTGQKVSRPNPDSTAKFCYTTQGIEVRYNFTDYDSDGRVDLLTSISGASNSAGGDFTSTSSGSTMRVTVSSGGSCPVGTVQVGDTGNTIACSCSADSYNPSGNCRASACPFGTYPNIITGTCDGDGNCPTVPCPTPPTGVGVNTTGIQCTMLPQLPEREASGSGRFVWRLQRNLGGIFAPLGGLGNTDSWLIYSPVPLPSGATETQLAQSTIPGMPGLVDITGDGYLDAISFVSTPGQTPYPPGQMTQLYVWPGNGRYEFGAMQTWPFELPANATQPWQQAYEPTTLTTVTGGMHLTTPSTAAFRDVNGDGLPDFLVQANGHVSVSYNLGSTAWAGRLPGGAFASLKPMYGIGPIEQTRAEVTEWRELQKQIVTGTRGYLRRLVDTDGDGRLEMVVFASSSPVAAESASRQQWQIAGGGGGIDTSPRLGVEWEAIESLVSSDRGNWVRTSDFLDVTGDGLPDAVTWANGTATIRTDAAVTSTVGPMRLLTHVDNGRGSITRFEYTLPTDSGVLEVATDARGLGSRWLVARVVVSPGFGQPEQRATYRYRQPVFGQDTGLDRSAPHFRGFAKVTIETSGAQGDASRQIVSTFDYSPLLQDRGPRPLTQLTSMKVGSSWVPTHHQQISHDARALFAGQVSASFVAQTFERTCSAGTTPEGCAGQNISLEETTNTWSPWSPGPNSAAVLLLKSQTRESLRDGTDPRYTSWQYQVRYMQAPYASTDYRVLEVEEQRGRVWTASTVNGTILKLLPWSRTVVVPNAAGLPEETRVYKDATTFATTRREFHPSTGNVSSMTRPNQVAAGSAEKETYLYDPHALRVRVTTNYASVTDAYDVATGVLVQRTGPDMRLVDPPGGCWWFCWNPVYESERWTIDGFGRIVEHYDSRDPEPGVQGYVEVLVQRVSYFDGELPNRRVTQMLRTATAPTVATSWVSGATYFDGLGRVTSEVLHRQRSGQCDAVTSHGYDAAGDVRQVTAPSPSTDCATVTTSYARDGLGRPTLLTRPDGSQEIVTYNGLDIEVQRTSDLSASGTRTTMRKNARGELREVHEHDNPLAGQTAISRYTYDPLGRMATVVDADGALTMLGYDWRGLRTAVIRGGRSWTYEYDASSNLTAETEPVPAGQLATSYRSTITYDHFNRPLVRTPAIRDLDQARRSQLGIGPVTATYGWSDLSSRPAMLSLPFGTIVYTYDARGKIIREERSLTVGTPTPTTQSVERRYDALGAITSVRWDDATEWSYVYDSTGALSDVTWREPSSGQEVVLAHYDRVAAGQPFRRTSPHGAQQRDWRYDALGRVEFDRVWSTATATTFHERNYGYDSGGELRVVDGSTNGLSADAVMDYDAHHHVVQAQGPIGYDAAFTYTGGGNVKTAAVRGASDVPDRNVSYAYGAVDSQAVDRLTDVINGVVVASLDYDRSGNTVRRTLSTSGSQHTFVWDSDGQLREAVGPFGTERYFFGPGAERMASIGPEGIKVWFGESETLFNSAGTAVRRYHHIAAGEPIARIENRTSLELQYADALQNLVLAVRPSGQVTASAVYGAFGEVVAATDATSHSRRFNGKEHDAVSGLRHYGYRSYDPVTLRWVSADPLYRFVPDLAKLDRVQANLYAFSSNNPLQFYDPDGRQSTGDWRHDWTPAMKKRGAEDRTPMPKNLKIMFGVTIGAVCVIVAAPAVVAAAAEALTVGALTLNAAVATSTGATVAATSTLVTVGAKVLIDPGKFRYFFGAVTSGSHNTARSLQMVAQLARIGIHNTSNGRAVLQAHLQRAGASMTNITSFFVNKHGLHEVRESLLAGQNGMLKIVSTWQVTEGGRRLTTMITLGGP